MVAIAAPVLTFNVSISAILISAVPLTVIFDTSLSVPLKLAAVIVSNT